MGYSCYIFERGHGKTLKSRSSVLYLHIRYNWFTKSRHHKPHQVFCFPPYFVDLSKLLSRDEPFFIFISTTSSPFRFQFMAVAVHMMLNLKDDDIIYDPLPLYHTAGGMLGIGQAVLTGNTVAIRRKFSASNFWKDCAQYKCTVSVSNLYEWLN